MDIRILFRYDGCDEAGLDVVDTRTSCAEGVQVTTYVCLHQPSQARFTVTRTYYEKFSAEYLSAEIFAPQSTEVFDDLKWCVTFAGDGAKLIGNYGDTMGNSGEVDMPFGEYEYRITEKPIVHSATDGRPTHEYFPYYRMETDPSNMIVAIGAMGTWQTEFSTHAGEVKMLAGQYGVHTRLYAGETFHLPTLLLLPYHTDPTNTWRHFYFQHIMPKVKGEAIKPMLGIFNGTCDRLNQQNIQELCSAYERGGIDYDFWWFDAGWGTDGTGDRNETGLWWRGVNFDMNYEAFPDGMHDFGASLRSGGKNFMLWFEPELVRTPPEDMEKFYAAHPDFDRKWMLGEYDYEWCGLTLTAQMLNLGNDDCRHWLLKRVLSVMDHACADMYRQDMNIPPYEIWKKADAADRRGMAENRYVCGLKKYYEAIREHCGDILMDTCASGGGRCDIETLRYMIPLHHSDRQDVYQGDYNGHVGLQQVVWRWFPHTKNWLSTPTLQSDYGARSAMNAHYILSVATPQSPDADFARVKKYVDEWREIADLYLGDYYELEKPTVDHEHIKAFEYFSPEKGSGFVMVFVPGECKKTNYHFTLRGLSRDKVYEMVDKDSGRLWNMKGQELAESGVLLEVEPDKSYVIKVSERS